MQPNEPHTPNLGDENDILARMDAVLASRPQGQVPVSGQSAPTQHEAPAQAGGAIVAQATAPSASTSQGAPSVLLDPPAASAAPTVAAPTAARLLGIDAHRMIQLLEEEALSAQNRIDIELRNAQVEAQSVVGRAEVEAERIREHGQAQARVLLGEVEEIISEAQQTGEQILHRANDEAGTLRGEATAVLQQAHQEARSIVEAARRDGEQVLAEQRRLATVRAQEAMREQDRLKDQIRRLEERRRQVLESLEPLIAQLTQMMPTDAITANVVQLDRGRPAVQHQG